MSEYLENGEQRPRKRMLWGMILIGAGCLFLVDRMDIYEVGEIWRFWPAVIALAGVVEILSATRFKHVTSGFLNIVAGFWLYASIENLWGWTFGNSWPILMIAFGITVAMNGLVDQAKKSKAGS
ncbi:MAG TPA: DUF5668 domain-containing protein [Burkholderiaceae bacterium]|jgi:hypothetical protein|nr:DUF5668 domain-containing protein [Burkholderiaceae bacterium]